MADYRVYFLDDLRRHIISARQIEASDDDVAVSMAERMSGLSPLGLWREGEKIRGWDACPSPASSGPPRR